MSQPNRPKTLFVNCSCTANTVASDGILKSPIGNSVKLKSYADTLGKQTIKGGQAVTFIIALNCCTNLDYVEPAAGVEPATF